MRRAASASTASPETSHSARPGAFEPPAALDLRAEVPTQPWGIAEIEPQEARVHVDARYATQVVREVGDDAVVERGDDGSVVVGLTVTHMGGLRSWLLGHLDHVVVLSPPELVDDIVGWLAPSAPAPAVRRDRPPPAMERLRRVLVMIRGSPSAAAPPSTKLPPTSTSHATKSTPTCNSPPCSACPRTGRA